MLRFRRSAPLPVLVVMALAAALLSGSASAASALRLSVSSSVASGTLSVAVKATPAHGWSTVLERQNGRRWAAVGGARRLPRSGRVVFTITAPVRAQSFRVRLVRKGFRSVVSRPLKVRAGSAAPAGRPVGAASGPPTATPSSPAANVFSPSGTGGSTSPIDSAAPSAPSGDGSLDGTTTPPGDGTPPGAVPGLAVLTMDGPGLQVDGTGPDTRVAQIEIQAGHPFTIIDDVDGGSINLDLPDGMPVPSSNISRGLVTFEPRTSGLAFVHLDTVRDDARIWATSVDDHGTTSLPLDRHALNFDRPGRVERFEVPLADGDELDWALDTEHSCIQVTLDYYVPASSSCGAGGASHVVATSAVTATIDVYPDETTDSDADSVVSLSNPVKVNATVGDDALHLTTSTPGQRALVQVYGADGNVGIAALDSRTENISISGDSTVWATDGGPDRYTRFHPGSNPFEIDVQSQRPAAVDMTFWLSNDAVQDVTLPATNVAISYTRPGQAQVLRFTAAEGDDLSAVLLPDAASKRPATFMSLEDPGDPARCGNCATQTYRLSRLRASHAGTLEAAAQLTDRRAATAKLSVSTPLTVPTSVDGPQLHIATTTPGQVVRFPFAPTVPLVSVTTAGYVGHLTFSNGRVLYGLGTPDVSILRLNPSGPSTVGVIDIGPTTVDVTARVLSPTVASIAAPSTTGTSGTSTIDTPGRMVGVRFTPVAGATYQAVVTGATGPAGAPSGSLAFFDDTGTQLGGETYQAADARPITALVVPADDRTGTVTLKVTRVS